MLGEECYEKQTLLHSSGIQKPWVEGSGQPYARIQKCSKDREQIAVLLKQRDGAAVLQFKC